MLCGCDKAREAASMEGSERKTQESVAKTLQARWGCPRAGHKPPATLPPDLADEAEHWGRTVGAPPPNTCPGARFCRPCELPALAVYRLGRETRGAVSAEDALGRPLTAFEVRALEVLLAARADVAVSDERIRKAQEPPKK